MKTPHGKLALLAFALLLGAILFLPMRAGEEDSLLLEPAELKMSVGDSYTLRCALSSDDANQYLRFTSSDARIASIDADGTVRALASGMCTIRARASGGAHAETQVTVVGVPLTELKLNVDEVRIDKGQFSALRASYNADASDVRLKWISSDESVVKVDSFGRLEGVGGGEAVVTVAAVNGISASARVYVHVDGTAVHISPDVLTLGVGARVPLKVTYLPLDCTDQVRRWASSNPSVLSVDADGVLEAHAQGSAYISVITQGGLSCGMEVQVEAAPEDIQLDPSQATLERGDSMQMQLMFLEEDGSVDENSSHLTAWTSSDESVASVDQNGLVTALKSGSCRITATADGMTATCRLNVEVNIQEITLDQSEVYLLREQTQTPIQLRWVISPVDADDPTVTFVSDNEQVAKVDQSGLVTMTGGYGTAVITASGKSGALASFTVNVVTALPDEEETSADVSETAAPDADANAGEQTPTVTAVDAGSEADVADAAVDASAETGAAGESTPLPEAVG